MPRKVQKESTCKQRVFSGTKVEVLQQRMQHITLVSLRYLLIVSYIRQIMPQNGTQFTPIFIFWAHLKDLNVLFPMNPRFCKLVKKWLCYGQKRPQLSGDGSNFTGLYYWRQYLVIWKCFSADGHHYTCYERRYSDGYLFSIRYNKICLSGENY